MFKGSTREERSATLPGDELVPRPQLVTDHAGTIGAPPAELWPWLTQMGWHRAGYYTPPWVDRVLFPANRPSLDHLDPDLVRELRVGDTIPDGPPGRRSTSSRRSTPRTSSCCTPPPTCHPVGPSGMAPPSTGPGRSD